jgi:hypothetical protein
MDVLKIIGQRLSLGFNMAGYLTFWKQSFTVNSNKSPT